MKRADRYAIERSGIPSLRLMERAGRGVAEVVVNRLRPPDRVLIVCGKGNNGGDGLVVARLLSRKGFDVTVALVEPRSRLKGDAAHQYERLIRESPTVNIVPVKKEIGQRQKKYSVIIDAMLGTSSRGPLTAPYRSAVRRCNALLGWKIAIDLPTGMDGETGECGKETFRADVTVAISHPKIGFFRGRAAELTGEIVTVDIGIPRSAVQFAANGSVRIQLTEHSDVRRTFPRRPVNSHKHSVGKIFILAGSYGMTGAALLCSAAAMRSGAGQAVLGIPESEYSIVARRTVEVMPLGLPATPERTLSLHGLAEIERRIRWCDVVVIGCGLSRHVETFQLIRTVVSRCHTPMVIDADALSAFNGQTEILRKKKSQRIVLTPHMGEFSRLSGLSVADIEKDKFRIVSEFAKRNKVTVVLKGAATTVAASNGDLFINPTGNPGMATAGSGDVLAGIIAALIGQGNTAATASVNGVFLHGLAGDEAARKKGIHGMIARDIVSMLPNAMKKIVYP